MKRNLKIAIIVALSALIFALPVAAMGGGNVKGEVLIVGTDSFTMLSNKGDELTVFIPEGFDISTLEPGDSVLVRGELAGDSIINTTTIKEVGGGDDDEVEVEEVESEGEGSLADNSAFCAEDKQEKAHPMAVIISQNYDMTEEEVIGFFCEGNSFGAIMLALLTADINGGTAGDFLASRTGGLGWGQIWKGLDLVGSESDGASPPGHLKRPAHAGSGNPNQ